MPLQDDDMLARALEELQRIPHVDAALFEARVMAEVQRPMGMGSRLRALARPRHVFISPLHAIAAALLFAVAFGASLAYLRRGDAPTVAAVVRPPSPGADVPAPIVRFGFVAPNASTVALVGDFNNWDPRATPLVAAPSGGAWSVQVPIPPGRHLYAFVVNGTVWRPDPAAPRAAGNDFGEPNSALTVAEPSRQ